MNKKRLHHLWTIVRHVKPWYILVLCVLSIGVSVYALRQNNINMVKLRSAVYSADKSNGNVNGALKNLQAYVVAHMNTNLASGSGAIYPPIQLTYTYQRLQQAQQAQVAALRQTNSQLYTQAQIYCQKQDSTDFSGRNRVPCIESYVQSHGFSGDLIGSTIPTSLYEFAFISPTWSPDLAGWSLVASVVFFLLFIVSLIARLWLKHKVA